MKKLLVILAGILALTCALPALGEGCDDALDAAFARGSVTFVPADFPMPDPASCTLVLPPDAFWEADELAGTDEAQLREALAQGRFAMLDYAPGGDCGVGLLAAGETALPIAVSPDRVAVIWPAEARGVASEPGALGTIYNRLWLQNRTRMPLGLGDEGAIWSPGGRYFCVFNATVIFQQVRLENGSPIIVDTQTGEMFAVDSFSDRMSDENFGFWYGGCFSADERSFYAMVCSSRYENRYTPVRYDLETLTAEPCGEGFTVNAVPGVARLEDGSLLFLLDKFKREEAQAVVRLAPDGTVRRQALPLASADWSFLGRRFAFSPESGWALIRGSIFTAETNGESFGLVRLRPADAPAEGTGTVWTITAEPCAAEAWDAASLTEQLATDVERIRFQDAHLGILDMKLSPDGRYAALLTAREGEIRLLILRLEDMAILPAEGVDASAFRQLIPLENSGIPALNWSEAGLLDINGQTLWRPAADQGQGASSARLPVRSPRKFHASVSQSSL